jgi:hypothetical protein
MNLLTLPIDMQLAILEVFTSSFDTLDSRRQKSILNAIIACKHLYSIGLPLLYREAIVEALTDKVYSFFQALPETGGYIRKLRITQKCEHYRIGKPKIHPRYRQHDHMLAPDRLAMIGRYCCNLVALFIGWDCRQTSSDTNLDRFRFVGIECLKELIQQCRTVETLVVPSSLIIRGSLSWLKRLYLSRDSVGPNSFLRVIESCKNIQELYVADFYTIGVHSFLQGLELLPQLEVLHIQEEYRKRGYPGDPTPIYTLLQRLPLQNCNIHSLVLRCLGVSSLWPPITPESYPVLRFLELSFCFPLAMFISSSEFLGDVAPFLSNLRALRILHLDTRFYSLDSSCFNVIQRPSLQIYTLPRSHPVGRISSDHLRPLKDDSNSWWMTSVDWVGHRIDRLMDGWTSRYYREGTADDDTELWSQNIRELN